VHVAQSDVLVGGAEPAKTINDRTFYRRARIHLQRSIISLHVWEPCCRGQNRRDAAVIL